MNETKQIILFLLTRDVEYLPENYPEVDIKKWLKKNDLQRMREIKRLSTMIIKTLKEEPVQQTSYTRDRHWCPPTCMEQGNLS